MPVETFSEPDITKIDPSNDVKCVASAEGWVIPTVFVNKEPGLR
jgi:hypothetical protein